MDKFISEAESAAGDFQGQGNNQDQQTDQQTDQQNTQQTQQTTQTQQNQQTQSSSGGFMSGLTQAGEDGAVNTEVNNFLTKEGLPAGMDGAVDAFVDKEANGYLGGNKNF